MAEIAQWIINRVIRENRELAHGCHDRVKFWNHVAQREFCVSTWAELVPYVKVVPKEEPRSLGNCTKCGIEWIVERGKIQNFCTTHEGICTSCCPCAKETL